MANKFSSGDWSACKHGNCSCGMIWAGDDNIATITIGEWGDSWPALRFIEGDGMANTTAEAYMEYMHYGSVSKEIAAANTRLIMNAPKLHDIVSRLGVYLPAELQPEVDAVLASVRGAP